MNSELIDSAVQRSLVRGFLLAHNAPAEVLEALGTIGVIPATEPRSLPDDIGVWDISRRASNGLLTTGIDTLAKLLTISEASLLKIPNFGRKSLNEIKAYIAPHVLPVGSQADGEVRWNVSGGYTYCHLDMDL